MVIKTKKKLNSFFGILSDNEGEAMQKSLEIIRSANVSFLKERLKQ